MDVGGASELEYLASCPVKDWRYNSEAENILTFFYKANVKFGRPQPDDDIIELSWLDLKKLPYWSKEVWREKLIEHVMPVHNELMGILFDKVISKNEKLIVELEDVVED